MTTDYRSWGLDELGSYFSDFWKDMNGFRPRHVSFQDRDALVVAIDRLHRELDGMMSSLEGRRELSALGFYIPADQLGETEADRQVILPPYVAPKMGIKFFLLDKD